MQAPKVQTVFIPAPFGGMNRETLPINQPQTEANEIKGYSTGINSIIAGGYDIDYSSGFAAATGTGLSSLYNWLTSAYAQRIILTSNSKIISITNPGLSTSTDITGAVVITSGSTQGCAFNDYFFIVNGIDAVIRVPLSGNATHPGFIGPGGVDTSLNQVWSYKERLFFVEEDSTSYWYHPTTGGVSGALTEVNLNNIFDEPAKLLLGAKWSTNSGSSNDEYCVFISSVGEVLVYSGDYPDSDNWSLSARTFIPKPIGAKSTVRIGGDLMIITSAGIISLSKAIANGSSPSEYYEVSQKIQDIFQATQPTYVTGVRHPTQPYFYFIVKGDALTGVTDINLIFVLNSRTGAWSYISTTLSPVAIIYCNGFGGAFPGIYYVTGTATTLYAVVESFGTTGRLFKTGWIDLGTNLNKKIIRVRLLIANAAAGVISGLTITQTLTIKKSFNFEAAPGTDQNTQTVSGTYSALPAFNNYNKKIKVLDFTNCGIVGQWFQFQFNSDTVIQEEVYGFWVDFEVGGGLIAQ